MNKELSVGHNEKIMTFLDPSLKNYEWIWAAAGTPFAVFRLSSHEIQKMTAKWNLVVPLSLINRSWEEPNANI